MRGQISKLKESKTVRIHRETHQRKRKDCPGKERPGELRFPLRLCLRTDRQQFMKKLSRLGKGRVEKASRIIPRAHTRLGIDSGPTSLSGNTLLWDKFCFSTQTVMLKP